MYKSRKKVLWFAIVSRLSVLVLQFIFNILCPDHNADAFRSPFDKNDQISMPDKIVNIIFGGLTRWDGEYFLHIAKYGYTYENTLAFYPLYPMMINIVATLIRKGMIILNMHSASIIAAVLINFVCFVKSAVIFYDLSKEVLKRTSTAYKAAILYCINPATIFFSAAYSESLFAYLTFYSMLSSVKHDPYVSFPLALSCLARSNGLISIGFPMYLGIKNLFQNFVRENDTTTLKAMCRFLFKTSTLRSCCLLLNIIIISLAPFLLLQIYNYIMFCIPDSNQVPLAKHIVSHGTLNNLVLRGNGTSEWCDSNVPVAYSYIQNKYWNVGFLRYYEFKQIPNFILALPVLTIMILCVREYFLEHKRYFYTLGLFEDIENEPDEKTCKYPAEMLVFVVHGLFLTVCCILFVHIQVSTRLICSASPLVYWYCALTMSYTPKCKDSKEELIYEDEDNLYSKWRVFFLSQKKYVIADKLILSYFLGYAILGCALFPNFLPWT